MTNNLKKKIGDGIFYTVFLFIFLMSICNNFYQYKNFDKFSNSKKLTPRHQLINGDIDYFWREGNDLTQDLLNGKNYFETGEEYRRPYLPSRLFALYSFLASEKLIDNNNKVIIGGKKIIFLFFQSIIFYSLLFFLYKTMIIYFSKLTSQICIFFLGIEPTIFMYHSSYWSESIFFSLLLLFIILILKNNYSFKFLFIIGLILGVLYLQRSVAIFYIFPLFIYFYFNKKKFFLKSVFFVSIGYILIHLFVGYHNYVRTNIFYSTSTQAKDGFYIYLAPVIESKNLKISIDEAAKKLSKKKHDWANDNKINLNLESDRLLFYNYQKNEALKILIKNPINSFKAITEKSLHFYIIDPLTHVFYFHRWNYDNGHFYGSEAHNKWITPRIFYSIFIYFFCILGFVVMFKDKKNNNFLLFLSLSIIYFSIVQSWYGGTRYFAPILIFLSFLFACGFSFLIKKIKKDNL
ncbi:hypothetical protein HIMB5_00005110 [alpha proteobacterium HIMB5]|nr:hypothetical protein HIMB5_00005110 [alpha proteobacterium HIMB5]